MAGLNTRTKNSGVRIASAATTVVKQSAGVLSLVTLDTPVNADTLTFYDALSATGDPIAVITVSGTIPLTLTFDIAFSTGLTVVSSGTTGAVVAFQ